MLSAALCCYRLGAGTWPAVRTPTSSWNDTRFSDILALSHTIQYNEIKLMFAPLVVVYHEGAMIPCNMPWWAVQSCVDLGNWQQTETYRGDQAADCSKSLDLRRRKREAHSEPSESVERRGRSWRQNADECGRMSPTLWMYMSARYDGAVRCWHLLTNEHNLNWMRWRTDSQWRSSRRVSVIWSNLRLPMMRRAAALITDWSGRRLVVVMPWWWRCFASRHEYSDEGVEQGCQDSFRATLYLSGA